MLLTRYKNFARLMSNGLSNSAPTRAFSTFYTGKSPKMRHLKNVSYRFFSALGAPNIPIFGLETDISDIYKIMQGIFEILIFWQNMAILGVKNSPDPDFRLFFGLKMAIFCLKSKISKIPYMILQILLISVSKPKIGISGAPNAEKNP